MKKIIFLALATISIFLSAAVSAQPLDINTADSGALAEAIDGVGPKRAEAIVEYRDKHGAFKTVDDLQKVQGIGPVLLENNRDNLVVTPD